MVITEIVSGQTLKGKLLDEHDRPLEGAAIVLTSDEARGCTTGSDGRFSFSVPSADGIEITILGYRTHRILNLPNTFSVIDFGTIQLVPGFRGYVMTSKKHSKRSVCREVDTMKELTSNELTVFCPDSSLNYVWVPQENDDLMVNFNDMHPCIEP